MRGPQPRELARGRTGCPLGAIAIPVQPDEFVEAGRRIGFALAFPGRRVVARIVALNFGDDLHDNGQRFICADIPHDGRPVDSAGRV